MIAAAEVNVFVGAPEVSDDLRATAWRLLAIAAAGKDRYEADQRQAAFRVSAHVLELSLASVENHEERLLLLLAATIAYRLGDLDPNAEAMLRSHEQDVATPSDTWTPLLSLRAALRLVSLQTTAAFQAFKEMRSVHHRLVEELGDLAGSTFWASSNIVEGCMAAMRFLVFGDSEVLAAARECFARVAQGGEVVSLSERWTAVLLRDLCDDFETASIWTALPSGVTAEVRSALTKTRPSVLLLWPPQREVLMGGTSGPGLLDPDLRRAVVAVPTSGGKTLLALIVVVDHVARDHSSVCFVAPMRTLVREVRGRIRPRLRAVDDADDLGGTAPDFLTVALRDLYGPATVDVVTPERLLAHLRSDPDDVLGRYKLFIFDEAHHLGDRERGFVLEEAIAFLHAITKDTKHRIVLLSAALGNDAQVRAWLTAGDDETEEVASWSSAWRGPRQLLAVFSTDAKWDEQSEPYLPTPRSLPRRSTPLTGKIRLSIDGTVRPIELTLREPSGVLVQRQTGAGDWKRDSTSTSPAELVAQVAHALEHAGPVLTVTNRRAHTRDIALALAKRRTDGTPNVILGDLVSDRLGEAHPLVQTVARGIAFHHAGLPPEILNAIVDEYQAGALVHIVCTTTLTDGVNMPVHSVVIAEYGTRPDDRWIRGPKLVNALGRAGRAGIETTGWVVLYAGGMSFQEANHLLHPSSEELAAKSVLASQAALEELAKAQGALADAEALVFGDHPKAIRDFISFVWWLAATREVSSFADENVVTSVLDATFGFSQLGNEAKRQWFALAQAIVDVYTQTPVDRRRRWSKSGLSISSSRRLDDLVEALVSAVAANEKITNVDEAWGLLVATGVVHELLSLPEAPTGHAAALLRDGEVQLDELGRAWMHGASVPALSAEFLIDGETSNQQERMVEAISEGFEYFLPWTLASVIDTANEVLEGSESEISGMTQLFLRYGVDTAQAVQLLVDGVRSRRLANAVGRAARDADIEVGGLSAWLATVPPADWLPRFEATPVDVLDLLDVTRSVGERTLRSLLRGDAVTIALDDPPDELDGPVILRETDEGLLSVVAVGTGATALLSTEQQADIAAVWRAGTPLAASVDDGQLRLVVEAF